MLALGLSPKRREPEPPVQGRSKVKKKLTANERTCPAFRPGNKLGVEPCRTPAQGGAHTGCSNLGEGYMFGLARHSDFTALALQSPAAVF
jgi:hypothetical protein